MNGRGTTFPQEASWSVVSVTLSAIRAYVVSSQVYPRAGWIVAEANKAVDSNRPCARAAKSKPKASHISRASTW